MMRHGKYHPPEQSQPAEMRAGTSCGAQATVLIRRRAASEIIKRAIPLNSMLIPTSMPSTHAELDGQVRQIMTARITVIMASTNSHPDPGEGRRRMARSE